MVRKCILKGLLKKTNRMCNDWYFTANELKYINSYKFRERGYLFFTMVFSTIFESMRIFSSLSMFIFFVGMLRIIVRIKYLDRLIRWSR